MQQPRHMVNPISPIAQASVPCLREACTWLRCLRSPAAPGPRRLIGILITVGAVLSIGAVTLSSASAQQYTEITSFAKNDNMQRFLQPSFPSGDFTADNTFSTPFDITSDGLGNNFAEIGVPYGNNTYVVDVNVANVTNVSTLINAFNPVENTSLATVEFVGSGGADQTFTLVNGTNVRDVYNGFWANTINGTTTQNAFTINNAPGGVGTNGAIGTYRIDEQNFALEPAFAGQTLEEMVITATAATQDEPPVGNGIPILMGVTVETPTVNTPEASEIAMFALWTTAVAPLVARKRLRLLRASKAA